MSSYLAEENVGLNSSYGIIASFWYSGSVVQMVAVILSNIKILLVSKRYYLLSVLIVIGSVLFYIGNLGIVNEIAVDQLYYIRTL